MAARLNIRRIVLVGAVLALIAAATLVLEPNARTAEAAYPGANGKIVFVSDRDSVSDIYVMNSEGGDVRPIVPEAPVGFDPIDSEPVWSPDGSHIAFVSDRASGGATFVMDADGGNVRGIGLQYSHSPSWSPDGTRVVVSSAVFFNPSQPVSRDLYIVDVQARTVERITETEEVEEAQPAWSPDGSMLAFAAGDLPRFSVSGADIYVADQDGQDGVNVTNHPSTDRQPDWSPDGARIAFVSGRDGDSDIYSMNVDGTDLQQLTDSPGTDWFPAWSPDGSKITFASDRDGNSNIYVMNPDGTSQTRITSNATYDSMPDWQPILNGDVTCNHGVNAIDAALLLQFDAGLLQALSCPEYADVNEDGDVDAVDGALVLQFVAGLLPALPP